MLTVIDEAGDYIDLRAEIDVLAAVSACPSETSASNGGEPKPIGLEVWIEGRERSADEAMSKKGA